MTSSDIKSDVKLTPCKSCGQQPVLVYLYPEGVGYECSCGLSAFSIPPALVEKRARRYWNELSSL